MRQQASYCSFSDVPDALKDQLREGVRDPSPRKKLLEKKSLALEDAQAISRQHETTEASAKGMLSTSLGKVRRLSEPPSFRPTPAPRRLDCSNCGMKGHLAGDARCKARNQTCHFCGRRGHFASKCRSSGKTATSTASATQSTGPKPKPRQRKMPRATARLVDTNHPCLWKALEGGTVPISSGLSYDSTPCYWSFTSRASLLPPDQVQAAIPRVTRRGW